MNARASVVVGALLAALAIAAGAFGAHALRGKLTPEQAAWFETAAHYQLVHGVALVALGAIGAHGRACKAASLLLCAGTLIFSGTLYAMALGAPRWSGAITPIGGVAMIAGWVAVACARSTQAVDAT